MKLDLSNPVVQRIVQDDRPIALRKRRRSNADKTLALIEQNFQVVGRRVLPKTPSKAKKKVRFSDPGPEINSSTGLTPALRSTSLGAQVTIYEQSFPATPSHRRTSLPAINTKWDLDTSMEIQFAPIRQVLTPRLRRQIARKDLSDEMNKIEDDKKLINRQESELRELREVVQELRKCKSPADVTYIEDSQLSLPNLDLEIRSIPGSQHSGNESVPDLSPLDGYNDSTGIYIDPDCQSIDDQQPATPRDLFEDKALTTHQAVQTVATASALEDHIASQTAHLVKARVDLERIFPGETTLPLSPTNGDCAPLLDTLLSYLRSTKTTLQSTRQSYENAETQRLNLRGQFNTTLAQLDGARESYAELLKGARAGAEKYAQARHRIVDLEEEVEQGTRSAGKLRKALDTYRTEVQSLETLITRLEEEGKEKLDQIQNERDEAVADLECAVAAETRGRREAEQESDTRALQIRVLEGSQQELKDAISEKQAIVRNLEEELDQVKSSKEQEVGSLNVRISRLVADLAGARSDVGKLEKEKTDLFNHIKNLRSKKVDSLAQLRHELQKAIAGVENVVDDMERDIAAESTSFRVAGLVTPSVEGGRFRDVSEDRIDGTVEVTRGKSRRSRKIDSAIGLLDEDIMNE